MKSTGAPLSHSSEGGGSACVAVGQKDQGEGGVLVQIEHERGLVRDFETKFKKQTEVLVELMERKYTLQREIEELEALSAAAESQQGNNGDFPAPGPPQGPGGRAS